jgi:hypothetical protein
VCRDQPCGDEGRVRRTARKLGLESSFSGRKSVTVPNGMKPMQESS